MYIHVYSLFQLPVQFRRDHQLAQAQLLTQQKEEAGQQEEEAMLTRERERE